MDAKGALCFSVLHQVNFITSNSNYSFEDLLEMLGLESKDLVAYMNESKSMPNAKRLKLYQYYEILYRSINATGGDAR